MQGIENTPAEIFTIQGLEVIRFRFVGTLEGIKVYANKKSAILYRGGRDFYKTRKEAREVLLRQLKRKVNEIENLQNDICEENE